MNAVPFDTHEVVKELKATGFTDEQAEALTRVVRDAQSVDLSNLVRQADLQIGLAELKAELLKYVLGAIGFQTLVILGAVIAKVMMAH